jgi:acyl-CoA synthetase (NDP forming)
MLEARSVAIVGASPRPGSFGERLLIELDRSPSRPSIHLVNPRYEKVGSRACLPSLGEIPDPVDLVALAVGDHALEDQLAAAAARRDRSTVIYGSAFDDPIRPGRRDRLRAIAEGAGMAVCGAGCMGFINVTHGLRAVGYLEPDPLPAGPIALVTHSGSAFSALLRADRRLGWTLAVSAGQELVTTTADYVDYAIGLEGTRVIALLLETLRRPGELRAALGRAADADIPVVALTVGGSPGGRAMVAAHSGALAGDDAAWEALCDATGMVRVGDLAEMVDTLELFAAGRRPPPSSDAGPESARPGRHGVGRGIASVHDSGAERAHLVDVAHTLRLPFASVSAGTVERLGELLDPGLEATNPLDVWGTGAAAREVFGGSLAALAADPAVGAVALCVDLVAELDGDESYLQAAEDAWDVTDKPLCVLSNLPSAIDRRAARRLRQKGIPVLEGTRSGLLALRHLLDFATRDADAADAAGVVPLDEARRARWHARLVAGPLRATEGFALLADYGIAAPAAGAAGSVDEALEVAATVGYPVVVKTDRPGIVHKSDVGGVVLGVADPAALRCAYLELAGRLGPDVVVAATAPPGVEMALGLVRDPLLGPLVVVGAGGVLVEVLADRRVGLVPLTARAARRMLDGLAVRPVLDGLRGGPVADLDALTAAVVGLATLAAELGAVVEALDVNPLRCGPYGVLALDVLVECGPTTPDVGATAATPPAQRPTAV